MLQPYLTKEEIYMKIKLELNKLLGFRLYSAEVIGGKQGNKTGGTIGVKTGGMGGAKSGGKV